MKIAFEIARGFWGTAIDCLSGRVGYCHVELIFSDQQWFSSVHKQGVRFTTKTADEKRCFRIYDLDSVTPVEEAKMRSLAELLVKERRKYNYLGVLRFVFPIRLKLSKQRDFCSEVCSILLKVAGQLHNVNPLLISPNVMFLVFDERDWLKERVYELSSKGESGNVLSSNIPSAYYRSDR